MRSCENLSVFGFFFSCFVKTHHKLIDISFICVNRANETSTSLVVNIPMLQLEKERRKKNR